MANINAISTARNSAIAGRDQIASFEAAQHRQERNQLEAILGQIDRMSLEPARRLLANCEQKLRNQAALLGGVTPDWQDYEVVRAVKARIEMLERCSLLQRNKFH